MPERERASAKATSFKGQKSGLPLESYDITGAELIQNFYLKDGQLKKINGNVVYGTVPLAFIQGQPPPVVTGGVISLHRYRELLIAQRGDCLFMESYTVPSPGLLQAVKGEFGVLIGQGYQTAKFFGAVWRNVIFLSNSQDLVKFQVNNTGVGLNPITTALGMDPPPDPLTGSMSSGQGGISESSSSGGNVEAGDHYYMIALYDSVTNSESPCWGAWASENGVYEVSPNGFNGPITNLVNTSSGTSIIKLSYAGGMSAYITQAKSQVPRATHFIVYRGQPKTNGAIPDDVRRVPNTATTVAYASGSVLIPIAGFLSDGLDFLDTTAFTSLPAVPPPTNTSPPPTPARLYNSLVAAQTRYAATGTWAQTDYLGFRHFRFFRDQLFAIGALSPGLSVTRNITLGTSIQTVTGVVNDFNDLIHASEVFQPDGWPYVWEVGVGDGQRAIGLGVLGDTAVLCFKEKSCYYLSGSSAANYIVRIMDTQKGCVDQSTIQETPAGVITLDRMGFVLWNKIGQGEPISEDIRDIIDSIDFNAAASFWSCYDAKNNLYRCGVVASSGTPLPITAGVVVQVNMTCTLNLFTMQWSIEQNGQVAAARVIDTDINFNLVDVIGSPTGGQLLDCSGVVVPGVLPSVLNNGAAIEAVWQSGTINFGDDQHKKKMNWIYLRAKSNESWTVDVWVIPDYDISKAYIIRGWSSVGSFSTWYSSTIATDGDLIWDDGSGNVGGEWSQPGLVRQVSKIPIKSIGRTFQIRIVHKDTVAENWGFTIESVSAEATMLGR